MKELGGYIEFEHYHGALLHDGAIALNCGRNALAYLFKTRGIRRIKLPYFLCSSIPDVCRRENVAVGCYRIGPDFLPEEDLRLGDDEWLFLVNFYGQLNNEEIAEYSRKYKRVIVDNTHSYFQEPVDHVDTLYSCRKFFGVPDGAFLYTDAVCPDALPQDVSFERMRFLLGRYEKTAGEFYGEYQQNNRFFVSEPVKRMSKLTENLLRGIDYKYVVSRRKENFAYLHQHLSDENQLAVKPALFMYPFMIENGKRIRAKLLELKIYIPTLWPAVFNITNTGDIEYKMAENILPLPIDQRYGKKELRMILESIKSIKESEM